MYGKYNASMHRGVESAKPGKALHMSNKENWTESPGGQGAGLARGAAGAARRRRTMKNRGQGTGHAGKSGHMGFPRPDANGYY